MTKALIIAGDYRQYVHWIESNCLNQHEYKYIRYPFHIEGYCDLPIYGIGTYYKNPLYKDILLLPTKKISYVPMNFDERKSSVKRE